MRLVIITEVPLPRITFSPIINCSSTGASGIYLVASSLKLRSTACVKLGKILALLKEKYCGPSQIWKQSGREGHLSELITSYKVS
jgi:hypothetical protein